jgi:hypothetical protein
LHDLLFRKAPDEDFRRARKPGHGIEIAGVEKQNRRNEFIE